ncbi:FAD-dependent monooxygenase [Parapedobacter deserti]|uniref:FAD-dependent monooxygenase n=1 Tax=Parapedobacter deserti TaxID=1912957 RepID=A0ABV7JGY5_9SPHI
METTRYTDVLIVGAGPSGLMMAAQLLRYGINPMIIDAKHGPDRTSRAIAVHARSLELFRQLGLADRLLSQGTSCYGVQIQGRKKQLGRVDFSMMENPTTPFPFIHLVGQEKTERLLIDRLTEHACPVGWETRLVSLLQDDRTATVELEKGGVIQRWKCKWIIGADGSKSTVRSCAGIPFEGRRYPGRFFLTDVQIDGVYKRMIHFFLPKNGFLGVFPLDAAGRYRLVGILPRKWDAERRSAIRYSDIKPIVDDAMGFELQVSRCFWISSFLLQRRMAEQFARQRCFLVGDAAHVHSPVGGQGMNGGLQDAANLAWKLAGVASGRIAPQILHSYQRERMPVAKATVDATDRVFKLAINTDGWLSPLRDYAVSAGMRVVGSNAQRLNKLFGEMAQLAFHYRKASLAVHHAAGQRVRAGDRIPFLQVFDEKTKAHTDLHRWCEKPGFVLLVLGIISHHHLHLIGRWMRQKYPREMHLFYLPYSPANQQVFDTFEVKAENTKIVLIRPDMHIGYMNDMLNVDLIDTYMEEVIGWKMFDNVPEIP